MWSIWTFKPGAAPKKRGRWARPDSGRVVAGVCAGLAGRWGVRPAVMRIAFTLLTVVTGGLFAAVYLVLAFLMPENPIARRQALADEAARRQARRQARQKRTPKSGRPEFWDERPRT